ncbi:peroxisomal membrane protein PEX16 [Maniola hyperantus]|uniref:peroxisomal membrane protein PEX16 n=1 Tax=Aphantopus hyperantus TaxID=2795564 RepID=UPI00156A0648|nr:peroxisomal membrane protein PEX16 [Maniola hyperantus]XP_034839358.1 peroxisomal membrane protein PEX16 [Maniola hyperantus]
MDKEFTLPELYSLYKRWVINNPGVVTDVETIATWSSYFVAGKINQSPIISELVYSISKLLSLFNDRIIQEAYGNEIQHYGLQEQIKLLLTIIHYCEVFVELFVKNRWGNKGKWTAATLLQIFKCSSAFILLYRFKEVPIQHPPIPALQRKKVTEGTDSDDNSNGFFTLRRSGRIVRRVDGSPPVALRDWQPITVNDNVLSNIEVKDLMQAELLHVLKPLIHLATMRLFGTKSWKQWLVALGIDLASFRLYNNHFKNLSYEQRLEISRRKLGLVLYLLRSPMYNGYSKHVIKETLKSASNKIPMMSFICGPILQYLSHWQDIYFYMWAS